MNFTSGVIFYQKMMVSVEEEQPLNRDRTTPTGRTKTTTFMYAIYWTHTPFTKVTVGWSVNTHHRSMLEVARGCADPFSLKFADFGDSPTILPVLYWNDAIETYIETPQCHRKPWIFWVGWIIFGRFPRKNWTIIDFFQLGRVLNVSPFGLAWEMEKYSTPWKRSEMVEISGTKSFTTRGNTPSRGPMYKLKTVNRCVRYEQKSRNM